MLCLHSSGPTGEMLMRSHPVVPEPKFRQRNRQLHAVSDHELTQPLFERAKQAFDAAVLPSAMCSAER